MANTNFNCPHCKQQIELVVIPQKKSNSPPSGNQNSGSVFSSISTSFVDDSPESITTTETRSFWANEAITDALRGMFAAGAAVAFGYAWQQSSNVGVWAAGIAFVGIVAFPTLRILANRPARPIESQADSPPQ